MEFDDFNSVHGRHRIVIWEMKKHGTQIVDKYECRGGI